MTARALTFLALTLAGCSSSPGREEPGGASALDASAGGDGAPSVTVGLPPGSTPTTSDGGAGSGADGGASASSPSSAVLYVATDGDDAWSGAFASRAAGSEGPLRTVAAAFTAAHARLQAQLPVSIQIRDGLYPVDSTLHLDASYSGTPAAPFTVTRYPGEHPTLSAGRVVAGWTPADATTGSYVADYPDAAVDLVTPYHEVWVDGAWAVKARYPKDDTSFSAPERTQSADWLFVPAASSDGEVDVDAASWPTVYGFGGDLAQAELHYYPVWYASMNAAITGVASPNDLTFNTSAYNLRQGTRYFLANVRSALRDPGEVFLDKAARKVFYVPLAGKNPGTSSVVASAIVTILDISGTPAAPVHDIVVDGLTFAHGASTALTNLSPVEELDALVQITRAHDVAVRDSYFRDTSGAGVLVHDGASTITVERSVFSGHGLSAVIVDGTTSPPTAVTLRGNAVDRTGLLKAVGALQIIGAGGNTVTGNQITRSGGNGINVEQDPPPAPSAVGNLVESNEVSASDLAMTDGGGIYVVANTGASPGSMHTTVSGNRVLASVGVGSDASGQLLVGTGGSGIYLDNAASDNTVENNVVSSCWWAGVTLNDGSNNTFDHNLFANNAATQIVVSTLVAAPAGNVFTHNYVIGQSVPGDGQPVWTFNGAAGAFAAIDSQLYWFTDDSSWAFSAAGGFAISPARSFPAWQSAGFDRSAGVADANSGALFLGGDAAGYALGVSPGSFAEGYGPAGTLVTGLRKYAADTADPASACIRTILGTQDAPLFSYDSDDLFACLNP